MRFKAFIHGSIICAAIVLCCGPAAANEPPDASVARQWNEDLLTAIRNDFARPTVHARNLFHTSAAMWDAWAAYDADSSQFQHIEKVDLAPDLVLAAREKAISYAAYRLLRWRFQNSPGAVESLDRFDARMTSLGFDRDFTSTAGDDPAALGNRIAATYIEFGLNDTSNEANDFANQFYMAVNEPLVPVLPGNPEITDPNRFQPLALDVFIDQSGNVVIGGFPKFLSPEWGTVTPFALTSEDLTVYQRDGHEYWVYHDPGAPPMLGGVGDDLYKSGFEQVALWSGKLDPTDGVMIDVSPASQGDNTLGTNDGNGHDLNPVTGQPYQPQVVPAGDYYRVLAEFWADGPDSETPPGHWFTIANYVSDHPLFEKKLRGKGPVLDNLQWDVKLYLALGGAMHDSAVAAWGAKGWYDYVRPVSAIRAMCDNGQSSDPGAPSYHPEGIGLHPGSIELITKASSAPGERHFGLAGNMDQHLNKIALKAWRGPSEIINPDTDTAGVGWIRCENWWPYQRPSFVTPPFAGYVSGHSTFSRAAAVVMTQITGDEYFPGGVGEFFAPANEFLVFEDGPSVDITLQWATYADASDETSLSRIYGGIHPTADDIPGRLMGAEIGADAVALALDFFGVSEGTETYASFSVRRDFTDSNPTEAEVFLSCSGGLILDQSKALISGETVEFVMTAFTPGELNCSVTAAAVDGYTTAYMASGDSDSNNLDGCNFLSIENNDENACVVTQQPLLGEVTINKQWVFEGSMDAGIDMRFNLTLICNSEIEGGNQSCGVGAALNGTLGNSPNTAWCRSFSGTGNRVFTARVIPDYPDSRCFVIEKDVDQSVESDNGCLSISIGAGQQASCTITNSVFYEGIPSLGKSGKIIMSLVMLISGWLGLRWLF